MISAGSMVNAALPKFQIRNLTISPGLVLAPMSGVTCSSFRRLIKRENPESVGLVVTEFISVEGLTRHNEQSVRMMNFHEEERPISIQIFGSDVSRMVDAALMAQDRGADIIDINCGCPVPKVVKRGGGCELMRQAEQLAAILTAVNRALTVPLTLKIRSGWDEKNRNAIEIARMAEDCGVSMLSIHGRTRSELYRGLADWEIIGAVADAVSIPVVGSGDVSDVEFARNCWQSGVAGLMIGRAALSNPWVFREISSQYRGSEFVSPSSDATVDVMERYLLLLLEELPERAVLGRLKQLASQITRRVQGTQEVRRKLVTAKNVAEFREILYRWKESLQEHLPPRLALGESVLTESWFYVES